MSDDEKKSAMEKTKKGQANTGPIRNRGSQKRKGNVTKGGKIAGNWQKSRNI